MSVVFIVLPLGLLLAAAAVAAFIWATRAGQFDDLEREGQRLLDDEPGAVDERQASRRAAQQE